MSKYRPEQIRAALAHEAQTFQRFMHKVEEENEELFYRYVYRLLLKIYELKLDDRYLTKMQACRLIPLRHQSACERYVREAEARGFIEFRPDKTDKRKTNIIPKPQLIAYVETEVEKAADELRETVAVMGEKALPKDNVALSGWRNPTKDS